MTRIQRTTVLLLAAGWLTLAACGQSGPLYLPGNPSDQVGDPAAESGAAGDGMEDGEDADARD